MCDALPYTGVTRIARLTYKRGTRIPRLRGVRNYLNNYFTIYKRLTRSRIREELASPTYLGLGII